MAQKESSERLGSILLEMGVLQSEQLTKALGVQRREIREAPADAFARIRPEVASLIPEILARRFNAIALALSADNVLSVAMEDPTDLVAQDLLSHVTRHRLDPVRAPALDIAAAIDAFYCLQGRSEASGARAPQSLEDLSLEVERTDLVAHAEAEPSDLLASAEETPVVKFVEALFRDSVRNRASDVHIEPEERTTNVRIRIDGVLQRLLTISRGMHRPVVSRIKILSGMNIAERRLPQDGRCRLKFARGELDVRVSTLPTIHGEKVVMRLLDKTEGVRDLDMLGLSAEGLVRFKEALEISYGMVLLTGPTGSGKTTTLYAALNYLNEPRRNIITIEDPVEYQIPGITQVQVRPEIGLTLARCLRHILRQDPNIVMVGEMRDLETTEIGVRAALTGHLVLSTIHANDAPAVVSRLLDIGIPPYLITGSLKIALAQRLVRRLCENCKVPLDLPSELWRQFGAEPSDRPPAIYAAKGCEACDYTGYYGRVGLFEVMALSPRVRELILNGRSEDELRKAAREEGMKTLAEQGRQKVAEGITSLEEVQSFRAEDQS